MDGETHSHFTLCPFDADIRSQRAGGTPESCRLEVYAAYASARNNLIIRESAEHGLSSDTPSLSPE